MYILPLNNETMICGYTNIYRYPAIHKATHIQIVKCLCIQKYEYLNSKVRMYLSVKVQRYPEIHVLGYMSVWVVKYISSQVVRNVGM